MKTIGMKQQTGGKGLGIKHNMTAKSLGVKGVYLKNNAIMPKAEPMQVTGILNKSNISSNEYMAKGLKGRLTK